MKESGVVRSDEELMQEIHQQVSRHNEKNREKLHKLEQLMDLLVQQFQIMRSKKTKTHEETFENPFGWTTNKKSEDETLQHLKFSFPKFTRTSKVKEWLEDCELYFDIYRVEDHKRSMIAGMHLEGVARSWYQVYTTGQSHIPWPEFCAQFSARFEALEEEMLYDSFKQLKQTSTVEHYFDQFEKLMEQLKRKMPTLTEEFFVESFVGGLHKEVKEVMRLLEPTTVEQAFKRAKYYALWNQKLFDKGSGKTVKTNQNSRTGKEATLQSLKVEQKPTTVENVQISEENQKETVNQTLEEPKESSDELNSNTERRSLEELIMEVYVHDIEGHHTNQTLVLTGEKGKHTLSILVDDGSTHSFLDETAASKLKYDMVETTPLQVLVANGNKLTSKYQCTDFSWKMGKKEFRTTVRALPMGRYDLVLGVDWLGSLGPVTFDYKHLKFTFMYQGQNITLEGNKQGLKPVLHEMSVAAFVRSCQRQENGFIYLLYQVPETEKGAEATAVASTCQAALAKLLQQFEDIFKAPTGLPPIET
ncbi:uncharacterized protein LOC141720727 isoform X1 [Apium graveolens]|uniref:uncharacterized protein LOC141720727 isoform X1 n=1 Tax=Apium graveolens TaxID=4045 RepID=UPI003D795ABF